MSIDIATFLACEDLTQSQNLSLQSYVQVSACSHSLLLHSYVLIPFAVKKLWYNFSVVKLSLHRNPSANCVIPSVRILLPPIKRHCIVFFITIFLMYSAATYNF